MKCPVCDHPGMSENQPTCAHCGSTRRSFDVINYWRAVARGYQNNTIALGILVGITVVLSAMFVAFRENTRPVVGHHQRIVTLDSLESLNATIASQAVSIVLQDKQIDSMRVALLLLKHRESEWLAAQASVAGE